uniref:Uncharacterized protein n=1 Tax=Panagrolaimus superbus TaxID=310955 RepID=A0A914Z052_9BILA
MTLIGSYILGSSGIRIYDTKIKDAKTYWVNDDKVSDPEIWTPELISDKTKTVFTEIPKLECLIIVDPGIYSNDCINAALEVAQNYSAKLKIIPALMARFCYVTSKTENPPRNLKEFLIIVTICRELCDWHILQLTSNGYDYIIDHLYEKKNFHDTVSIMAKRYSNYKTILLYSKDDEKFVSGLKLKCEKMYVPNWNQMLTEGGLQKGIWTNNSLTGRSKDVIDFASGMSLKIDDRPPLSLVKQGAKLPIKKKHSVFEDLRSFAINRDYQHVDYDKITRESCVIFQKELSCEVYKFNLNVRIEKNGQCFIDFQYQKQIFAAPTANVADNSSAQNSDEYATAESMSDKSTTSSLDNNSKALLSVEKETKI